MPLSYAAETGSLELLISPERAQIYLDGEKIGNTASIFKVPSGKHKVEIRKRGYQLKTLYVTVEENTVVTRKTKLKRIRTDEEKRTIAAKNEKVARGGNIFDTPMAEVSRGWFKMGSNKGAFDEKNEHNRAIASNYFIYQQVKGCLYSTCS